MSKWIRLAAVIMMLGTSGWILYSTNTAMPPETTPGTANVTLPNGFVVHAGLARTTEEKKQGLSGRPSLADNEGLLFLYENTSRPSYWMKDMLMPIDILWINEETLVGFEQNAQPETPPTTLFTPEKPINRVLEVPAGFVRLHELNEGDLLDITVSNQ